MRKWLALVLILVCIMPSAFADSAINKGREAAIRFNAYGKSYGTPQLDMDKMVTSGSGIIFPMDGYEVLFIFDSQNKIESAGVRLINESAAGDFLLSCMTIVSILGDIDYNAFGMILFQYSELRAGNEKSIPYFLAGDEFMMTAEYSDYKCLFAYANVKND